MQIENLGPVLPVPDLAAAVVVWSALLGAQPKFVDGDRWAQFEVGGHRLALAGTDRDGDLAGVMIKVDDLDEARRLARAVGVAVGENREGPHELRFVATAPGGWPIVFYAPRP
ncbi:MAG TPA: VOC family protein [Caulobacteraceae bacterium]